MRTPHTRSHSSFFSVWSQPLFPSVVRTYITNEEGARDVEIALLRSLASGKKTFQKVVEDAQTFGFAGRELRELVTTDAARGERLSVFDYLLKRFLPRRQGTQQRDLHISGPLFVRDIRSDHA